MIIGMDFGTTNTGAATFDGDNVHLLALDPASATPAVARSAIYMTRTGEYFLGSAAMSTYFDQNIGRPTRFRKVWVGEIIQIFAELPVFYRDVYVYEDEFSPGRLFTSIKTALRSRDYYGTAFRGNWFNASDLVAIYLIGMKMQMEQQLGQPVREVVLGRPVHFSTDPQEDQIAQSRLLDAAFKAGFERVFLELEPVAAALSYERRLTGRELILVFDFGGGTLDFTVMEVGGRGKRRVLSTGGLPIAGDIFDQRLFRATVPRHLGEGLEYHQANARRPIPAHIYDTLSQPPEILSLNTPQNLEMLQQIHAGSPDKEKTQALLKVVSSNYALMLFDLIERAKRELSGEYLSRLVVETADFSFHELVSRTTFERAIAREAELIRAELLATLERAGIRPERIDRVIRTGGSSQIPLFVNLLGEIFGYDKVQAIDMFSSVTSGLAIRGRQLAKGKADLPAYQPDSTARSNEHTVAEHEQPGEISQAVSLTQTERQVQPVDLLLVRKRLEVRQEAELVPDNLPTQALFLISQGKIIALAWDPTRPIDSGIRLTPGTQFCLGGLDEYLLLATNQFKLISAPVRDLYIAQQADPQGIPHSLPLNIDECVSALMKWRPDGISPADSLARQLVVMLTATGQGRAFDQTLLADTIARRPYFQLERRYNGIPVRLFSAEAENTVIIGTDQGRIARATVSELSVQPVDLLRLKPNEKITASGAVLNPSTSQSPDAIAGDSGGDPQVWAISSTGRGRHFKPLELPSGGPPGQRGQLLSRNFEVIAFLSAAEAHTDNVRLITNRGRLVPTNTKDLEMGFRLEKDELIAGRLEN